MRTLAAFSVVLLVAACQAPSLEMTVDLEANKQVVRDVYAAINAQDWETLAELWPDSASAHFIGEEETLNEEAFLGMMRRAQASFTDFSSVIDAIVSEGEWVSVMLTFHGTHGAEYEAPWATGNRVTYGGAHFVRIVDGVMTDWYMTEDTLGLMLQLGMELTPVAQG